jgi:hypothetical protein
VLDLLVFIIVFLAFSVVVAPYSVLMISPLTLILFSLVNLKHVELLFELLENFCDSLELTGEWEYSTLDDLAVYLKIGVDQLNH